MFWPFVLVLLSLGSMFAMMPTETRRRAEPNIAIDLDPLAYNSKFTALRHGENENENENERGGGHTNNSGTRGEFFDRYDVVVVGFRFVERRRASWRSQATQ